MFIKNYIKYLRIQRISIKIIIEDIERYKLNILMHTNNGGDTYGRKMGKL